MTDLDLSRLHTNQRLFVEELTKRGAELRAIDYDLELLQVTYNGKTEYLLDRTSKVTSYLSSSLAADKHLTKYVLERNGIAVPKGELFAAGQVEEAFDYAENIGYSVVIKPNVGSHGELIWSGIEDRAQLNEALQSFSEQTGNDKHFIVEEHIDGLEHRIFITTKGDYAVLQREPARVVGDGESTIRQLAEADSLARKEIKEEEGSALCPVALDQTAENFLKRKGMDFNSVPAADEKVYLRLSSNLAQGGLSIDMTDVVHPSAIEIAKEALAAFEGLPCLGVDFLTPDITVDQGRVGYAIIEANANPGLAMHHMPAIGQPRNVSGYLADVMFPDLTK